MIRTVMKMMTGSSANDSESTSTFRVAVPSWGFAGIRIVNEPEPVQTLSRDEIEALFQNDLSRAATDRASEKYTDLEREEMQITAMLRHALYAPQGTMAA